MIVLTIFIPTYNRPLKAAHQLTVLDRKISSLYERSQTKEIELLCRDNCSEPSNWSKLKNSCERLENAVLYRNESNLGIVGNCLAGLRDARGQYIWICGDDDGVESINLDEVLRALRAAKLAMVGLIHLNPVRIDGQTGMVGKEEYQSGIVASPVATLTDVLQYGFGALMWLTGNIVSTAAMRKALIESPNTTKLVGAPLYWNIYTAQHHGIIVLRDIHPTMVTKVDSWGDKFSNRILAYEIPMIKYYLSNTGLPPDVGRCMQWYDTSPENLAEQWVKHVAKNPKLSIGDANEAIRAGCLDWRIGIVIPWVILKLTASQLRKIMETKKMERKGGG